ncbi:Hypothetical predicted protein [Paramuricea clavata]|uniref:Uncharacterized protein n=1 Tax=Paramuricea clavata TaxID=317549 RepID=A0A6S7IBC8_PARCT|nr:Hypothetical predicted protein [Paramuricea clavata]
MGSDSEEEIFEVVREVEAAAKAPQRKAKSTATKTKPTADKSQTEHRRIIPSMFSLRLICGGCTTAKHVVAHKWNKKGKTEEISEEAKHILLHSEEECQTTSGRTPGKEQSSKI